MIEDKIQIDEEIKKLPFIEHYKKMWPFVKPYMFRAILAILICIPIGALDSVVALSLKPYMDIVLVDKTESSPAYIPLLIVAFTSVQGFLNYAATYLNTWVGTKINQDLKRALYKKLLHLETSYYDQHNSGFVIQRFNTDCDIACSGLLENLKVFVSRFFSSISLICVLIYNSWQLAIIAVLILGCALMPLASVRRRIKRVVMGSVVEGAKVVSNYNETYSGNKTIASYNLQNKIYNTFDSTLAQSVQADDQNGAENRLDDTGAAYYRFHRHRRRYRLRQLSDCQRRHYQRQLRFFHHRTDFALYPD